MFTQHQVDLYAQAFQVSEFEARDHLEARLRADVEVAHGEALIENTDRLIEELKAINSAPLVVDREQLDYAHGQALIEQRHRDHDRMMAIGSDADTPQYVADTAFMLASSMVIGWANRTAEIVGHDHTQARLDDMPCETCGCIEQHPNHRGARHMHRVSVVL